MAEADVRLIRLVRELDAEKKRRADAERSAAQAKHMNARLREQLRQLTRDAVPKGVATDK